MSYIDQITVGSTTYDIQDSTVPSWAKASAAPVLSVNNKTGVVSLSATDVGAYSKPSTGIPASDIASGVIPVAATVAPTMDGTATVGTSTKYAREDHKHPSDTAKINKDAELLTTNSFAPNSMRGPYISKIDNAFYAADKRWSVTATNVASGSVSNLFNGSYENSIFIENGNTSVITIDFSSEPTGYFPGYPYGYIILSFYYVAGPASVSGRVYCNYSTQGVGWHNITFTPLADNTANNIIYKSEHQAYYNISKVEITVVGDTTNSYGKTQLSQIEMHLDRPDSSRTPFLSKYGAETLYYNLTAPGFIGNLTGNASTATKATQDESGNNIKSSYGASLGISGSVLTLKNKNSAALSSVTLPAAPVTSVNNKTGAVVLTASDVGALPTTTSIPAAYTATPAALGTASAGSSPSWARGDHVHAKPTYSKSDVGLGNVDNVKQYSASNPPPYPVTSVNGSTGAVTITLPSIATVAPKDLASTASVGASTKYAKEDHIHKYPTPAQIGAGTYSKPSGGIPATDLASGVIPSAYTSNPAALGTASPGSSTSWARGDHVHAKPTYDKSDVGLGNVDNVKQYSASNPPPYPVTSVNGATGAVSISAVPAGGLEGQVLAKSSDGDYAVAWTTIDAGISMSVINENLIFSNSN